MNKTPFSLSLKTLALTLPRKKYCAFRARLRQVARAGPKVSERFHKGHEKCPERTKTGPQTAFDCPLEANTISVRNN